MSDHEQKEVNTSQNVNPNSGNAPKYFSRGFRAFHPLEKPPAMPGLIADPDEIRPGTMHLPPLQQREAVKPDMASEQMAFMKTPVLTDLVSIDVPDQVTHRMRSGVGASWHSILHPTVGHGGSGFGGTDSPLSRGGRTWTMSIFTAIARASTGRIPKICRWPGLIAWANACGGERTPMIHFACDLGGIRLKLGLVRERTLHQHSATDRRNAPLWRLIAGLPDPSSAKGQAATIWR